MATKKDSNGLDITNKQMLQELYISFFGVKGTEDKGLMGDVKDIKKTVETVCKSHDKLKRSFWVLVALLVASGILSVTSLLSAGG